MDFGITRVDLALEKSNPLTTHIVLYWKYSVEKKKIINAYEEINKNGVVLVNYNLILNILVKIIIFTVLTIVV